jgi:hypothetical protein
MSPLVLYLTFLWGSFKLMIGRFWGSFHLKSEIPVELIDLKVLLGAPFFLGISQKHLGWHECDFGTVLQRSHSHRQKGDHPK